MTKPKKTIDGQRIKTISTLGTRYDHNCVELRDDRGRDYRMNVKEILKIINGVAFKRIKKRLHTHLEVVDDGREDTDR